MQKKPLTKFSTHLWFSSVQSLSPVRLFATPWIAARQACLSITNSRSLFKLMPIELVMPYSHLILCFPFSSCPQSLPASGSFPLSQLFTWGGQSIGLSASASVLPMNTQDWSPLSSSKLAGPHRITLRSKQEGPLPCCLGIEISPFGSPSATPHFLGQEAHPKTVLPSPTHWPQASAWVPRIVCPDDLSALVGHLWVDPQIWAAKR